MSDLPLPYGWVRQTDPTHNHPYYVDTKANPPRSIWVHPYEDEQYLSEHPDVREKVGKAHNAADAYNNSDLEPPPADQRRHSYSGEGSKKTDEKSGSSSNPGLSKNEKEKKRGFLGKLKDKAVGTKEEREAEKRHQEELRRVREQHRQQLREQQLAALRQQQAAEQAAYAQRMYASPQGTPYDYGGGGGGMMGSGGGRRMGGGGMAMPLIGGMAGGLLLGSMLGDGGDFGGDGGDFGGGDFGGGF